MNVLTHRKFDKAILKMPIKLREKFLAQIELLKVDPFNKSLNNHALSGKYEECRSIDISGDWRVIYESINQETIRLLIVGTHSQLYG